MRLTVPKATIDLIGPTDCTIGTVDDRDRIVRRLGPDPLRDDADPQKAYAAIARRVAPIGQLLLDQKVISGVGNVYRAEALFVNRINPMRPGNTITPDDVRRVCGRRSCRCCAGRRRRRIVTLDRDEFDVPTGSTRRGDTTYVYHRDCACAAARRSLTVELGGRPCYYCPVDQPRADSLRVPLRGVALAAPVPQAAARPLSAAAGFGRPARTRINVAATRRSSAMASANGIVVASSVRSPSANAS